MIKSFLAVILLGITALCQAAVRTETVIYKDGGTVLEGFIAYEETMSSKRPGILIVHQWKGISDHERGIATRLAAMGYVAFCADIYGEGVRPTAMKEAAAQAGLYRGNRTLFRSRLNAGLAELKKSLMVDDTRTVAIGYCFGGTGVLELARSGADVKGVVSFHGGLDSPSPADGANIKAKVLIHHGADDPVVKKEDLDACLKELADAKVDYQFISYGGAVHSFTDKEAKSDSSRHEEKADRRSWAITQHFLGEVVGAK